MFYNIYLKFFMPSASVWRPSFLGFPSCKLFQFILSINKNIIDSGVLLPVRVDTQPDKEGEDESATEKKFSYNYC